MGSGVSRGGESRRGLEPPVVKAGVLSNYGHILPISVEVYNVIPALPPPPR